MKNIFFFIFILFVFTTIDMQAQNISLWGMTNKGGANTEGMMFKFSTATNTVTDKHDFGSGSDGFYPYGSLIKASNGLIFGMTFSGGPNYDPMDEGMIFSYDTATNTESDIHDFGPTTHGQNPVGSLMQASNGLLYGLTEYGGPACGGILFSYNISTGFYSDLENFTGSNGLEPTGSVIQASNGLLYGMTSYGGTNNDGIIFSYNTSTQHFSQLYDFGGGTDGQEPHGTLMQASNGLLYGTTEAGGAYNLGTIFSYNVSTGIEVDLHDFGVNSDGWDPKGALVQASNGLLYGTTFYGGINHDNDDVNGYGPIYEGTIFSYNISTGQETDVYNFGSNGIHGQNPAGSLIIASNGLLYGTTRFGDYACGGTIFSYNTSSNTFSNLYNFNTSVYEDGVQPYGDLLEYDSKPPSPPDWSEQTSLPPNAVDRPACFSIPSIGKEYIIAGYSHVYQTNAWAYDITSNNWSAIAAFPGATSAQVAFSIGGYGYVGTGTGANYSWDSTFWQYNPTANQWTKRAHFPGAPRAFAVGFEIDGKGYIGAGCDSMPGSAHALHDFYQYDPVANTWTTETPYPGHGCVGSVGFSIGSYGYVCTGDSIINKDFNKVTTASVYQYDPGSNTWTQKADFGGGTRGEGMGFATCTNGYMGCGYSDSGQTIFNDDFWQYKPTTNTWDSIAYFKGRDRAFGASACIGQIAYVGFGRASSNTDNIGDWWQYITPDTGSTLDIEPIDTIFCDGENATLYVNGGGSDFIWSPSLGLSATTGDFVVASPTATITYTVTGLTSGGCVAKGTDVVTVISWWNRPSFTKHGDTLISSAAHDNQWYRNDTLLEGDTSQYLIIPTITGWYWVNVLNEANGCASPSDSAYTTGSIEQISVPTYDGDILCEFLPPSSILYNEAELSVMDKKEEINFYDLYSDNNYPT